ncbi:MAG: hypothetical protein IPK07_03520 [Deltaproteobacteria bacterium]|jgi:hypothetical protein|nr:hypothetical protein [Deltaproteobacteria bacterium]
MNTFARRFAAGSLALAITASPALATTAVREAADSSPLAVETAPAETPSPLLLAQNSGGGSLADFEKAQDTGGYNGEYIFALTRGLANSTMHPAGKVPLFIFTLPLDVVFLPFAAIAGLFG